ncbi:MAG TPA: ATP-binding protein [Ktedonobacterales bacterium]|nr:ATP-binding protein [Ktedonobacterales bacterium]
MGEAPSRKHESRSQVPATGPSGTPGQPIADAEAPDSHSSIHEQAASLGSVLDAVPDGVILADGLGRIQLVNRQVEALFGYSRDELVGRDVEALMPRRFHTVHPAHRASYHMHPQVRPMGTGLQLFGLRRDGVEFPVEISLSPIEVGGISLDIAIIRDVTEQRRLEHAMREELEVRLTMLQAVLDELPADVYLVYGPDARLVLANRRVAEMWGGTWQEGAPMSEFLAASGARVYDLAGRELAAEQLATLQALHTGQSVRQQQEVLRRADGSTLPVMVDAVVLDPEIFPYLSEVHVHPSAPVPLVLAIHQDVSALKEAERVKDEFIALAAHELRGPIASLTGYAQMLIRPAIRRAPPAEEASETSETGPMEQPSGEPALPDDWQAEAVTAMAEAASRLTAFTDDLLDITRLHANRLALRPEPTELGALVRRVVRRMQVTTTPERHPITVQLPDDSVVVVVDGHRAEQVLTNLLGNAIKYSPAGGMIEVILDVIADATAAHAGGDAAGGDHQPAQRARVSVRDHGMGIPAEQQAMMFARFARADNAIQAGISGSGLGLYLCRELVERQDGSIWFESVEGAGTTVTFELPLPTSLPDDTDTGERGEPQ